MGGGNHIRKGRGPGHSPESGNMARAHGGGGGGQASSYWSLHPVGLLPSFGGDVEGGVNAGILAMRLAVAAVPKWPLGPPLKPLTCVADQKLCENGWTKFQGHCYRHFPDRATWVDAESQCRKQQSHLSSIVTPEEQEFVNSECGSEVPRGPRGEWLPEQRTALARNQQTGVQ